MRRVSTANEAAASLSVWRRRRNFTYLWPKASCVIICHGGIRHSQIQKGAIYIYQKVISFYFKENEKWAVCSRQEPGLNLGLGTFENDFFWGLSASPVLTGMGECRHRRLLSNDVWLNRNERGGGGAGGAQRSPPRENILGLVPAPALSVWMDGCEMCSFKLWGILFSFLPDDGKPWMYSVHFSSLDSNFFNLHFTA